MKFYRYFKKFDFLPRRLFFVLSDNLIISLTIWLTFWLRIGDIFSEFLLNCLWLFPLAILIGIPINVYTGQYTGITKYVSSRSAYQIGIRNIILTFFLFTLGKLFNFYSPPKSFWFIFCLLNTFFTSISRFILRDLLFYLIKITNKSKIQKVAIYGAGAAGAQLAASLKLDGNYSTINFFDDDSNLWGMNLGGVPIKSPKEMKDSEDYLDQILIAIPSLSSVNRKRIFENLKNTNTPILQIPSLEDIKSGKAKINTLKPIEIEDLLGRETVTPDMNLLKKGINKKNILITGAGGTIGSELCKQISSLNPNKLIILEVSEYSLYKIEQELTKDKTFEFEIVTVLGNCCNINLVKEIEKKYSIDTIFHAAAYKHVPLVEKNPISGIFNNVFSTVSICKAAEESNVSKVILISTDKAVRPSNIMGASKRLAELIIQDFAKKQEGKLQDKKCFSMVRFGNVLNSSGSVVPKFKSQIAQGGPITLTDEKIIRFFMTVKEAAQLVIQAAELGEGGEVFLIDMGKPIKIKYIAEQMIRLSGLTINSKNNPEGDIKIICTGLRPGEKLFEELLIDDNSSKTIHPLIYKGYEKSLDSTFLWENIKNLKLALINHDIKESKKYLSDLVNEWNDN